MKTNIQNFFKTIKWRKEMKKVILIMTFITLVIITNIDCYSWFKRHESGGRDNGPGQDPTYSLVDVYRDDYGSSIWCQYPGSASCPKSSAGDGRPPDNKTIAEQVCIDHAFSEIGQGNLSGNWTDPTSNYQVVWTAAGLDSEIRVWGPGETEPEW